MRTKDPTGLEYETGVDFAGKNLLPLAKELYLKKVGLGLDLRLYAKPWNVTKCVAPRKLKKIGYTSDVEVNLKTKSDKKIIGII
ncbi:hypothetical protein BpHYR1_040082 [Brachionus plicatilis]|uniref:Uncharacterized protein n=1 Tax=Brachionus plicatilis TaxID=10195 RepID=A0A3M7RD93_BRAPC|nr:hypothetical protein BpHYR1_040082 [Brachionus plicatilis]